MHNPTDSRFPHLAAAFDVVRMRTALQEAFFGTTVSGWMIGDCEIEETLYKPGRSCVLVYRLELVDITTGSVRPQLVCARLCRSGKANDEYTRAQAGRLVASAGLPPVAYLAELEIVAWTFPNDPALKRLPDMLNVNLMRSLLPSRLPALDLCCDYRLKHIQADVLHYRTERTCMLRYQLDIENRATAKVSPLTVYGKIYGSEASADVFQVMAQLAKHSPRLVTAIPLGYDAELNAVWQSHLCGESLHLELSTPSQCLATMAPIAQCVAAFHTSALESIHVATTKQILSQLAKTVRIISGTYPQMGARVARLVRHLTARTERINFSTAPEVPIHRDLKLANFLLVDDHAALIDLDEVSLGDPLIDIGSFIAAFSGRALLLGWDQTAVDTVVERFLRHYAARVTWPVARERLDWYVAASFVYESIHRGVRQWDVDKLRNIPRWLSVAERYAYGKAASNHGALATLQPRSYLKRVSGESYQ